MKRLLALILGLVATAAGAQSWWQAPQGPVVQVLVYSFADSNGDGIGDLRGLTHRLDAISDLGATAIWLSPIQPAASYHGYDVTDYKAIDPRLGTIDDFDELVRQAHARGLHVVLDMVFNHTSIHHPWFQAHPDWYVTKKPGVTYGSAPMGGWYPRNGSSYFATFWDGMPDLDVQNPAVVAALRDVVAFWLRRGVDGFRFDAANLILNTGKEPEGFPVAARTKAWWNDLRDYERSLNPDVYTIGEVYTTSTLEVSAYAGAFDGLFDFPQAKLTMDLPRSGDASDFAAKLDADYRQYRRHEGFVISPFLTNHDQDRAMTIDLRKFDASGTDGWATEPSDSPAVVMAKRLALTRAAALSLRTATLPGLPYLYYGEELGMTGQRYGNDDIARRDAYPWGDLDPLGATTTWMRSSEKREPGENRLTPSRALQEAYPGSLLNWYRALGTLRRQHPVLGTMDFTPCSWPGANQGTVTAYFRKGASETLLAAINWGEKSAQVDVPSGTTLTTIVSRLAMTEPSGTITLAPGQTVLWSVR